MANYKNILITFLAIFILMTITMESVYSRGGGRGGGSVSRSGPASSGSMNQSRANRSSQRTTSASSNRGNRQENRTTNTGDRQTNRNETRDDRYDHRNETRDDRYDNRDDVRDDRQDFADDVRDDRYDYYGHGRYYYDDNDWAKIFAAGAIVAVGTAVAVSAFQSTSCPSSYAIYSNTTYYQCGDTWYTKGYQSGEVVYIATTPPAGY